MSKRPNMQEIADRLGLSRVAVSKALNGKPGVSEETRAKVEQTARLLGYRHRSRSQAAKRIIGVIATGRRVRETLPMSNHSTGFYDGLLWGIERSLGQRGMQVLLQSASAGPGERREFLELTSGVFVVGPATGQVLKELAQEAIPLVSVNHADPLLRVSSVTPADLFAGQALVEKLVAKGHESIGFFGPSRWSQGYRQRWLGVYDALRNMDRELDAVLDGPEWADLTCGYQRLKERFLQSAWRNVTAWILVDARFASMLEGWIEEQGGFRPELAGFMHNVPTKPALPDMLLAQMRIEQVAEEAVTLLSETIEHPDRSPRHVQVPPEFVYTRSTTAVMNMSAR